MSNTLVWLVFGVYALALAFIFSFSVIQIILVFKYLKKKKSDTQEEKPLTEWPKVTIQLPLYNEQYVVQRLIENIAKIEYPKECLEIQVLDDSTDATTQIIQDTIDQLPSDLDIKLVRRPKREGFKAGALKYGLEIAKGEYIAIFDADFLPNSDFLLKTIPAFTSKKIGVVQTRWGHINKGYSILTQLQAFALDAHFTIEQVGRSSGGHFINFNGTGGVWRKSCIIDAGNWESDTLTEDLDLSYRAQMKDWKFKYLEDIEAPAELPATMTALKSQQFRWTKGAAETARKHVKNVWKSEAKMSTKIHGMFHLLNSGVFISVLTIALLSVPVLIMKNEFVDLSFIFYYVSWFLISLVTLALFYAISYFQFEKFTLKNLLRFSIRFPLFLSASMGLSLHNGLAVIEGYMGKKSPFVRTPKFNITEKKDSWKRNIYHSTRLPAITYIEGLLVLYFSFGVALAAYYHDFSLLLFHGMLIIGYGFTFFYSVKHARI